MKRILFIEDDVELQKIYIEAFSQNGFDVVSASTVDEGMKVSMEHKPDLVILDIMLPGGKNGFDALEALVADKELGRIPVLILTNLDSEKKVAMDIGAKDYLVKANTSVEEVVTRAKELVNAS